jgi:thiamine biosynthesis lipoprotein
MACPFEVFFNAGQYADAMDVALAALDRVDALEAQLTVYRETSEIMEINRRAAREALVVEPRLFDLLHYACQLHAETAGAYDITSGPLSKVWGFYRRQGQLPEPQALAEALARVGSQHVELSLPDQTIRFRCDGMELNLGSIGKGYALDRATEVLAAAGMEHFLWHGGRSSILARGSQGSRPDAGWLVSIGDPVRPGKTLAQVRLRDRALGTSGCGTQFFRHGGRRYGHILDPRTGWPAEGMLSATAVAPTAAQADALATVFYVLGPVGTLEYCGRHPEVAALLAFPKAGGLEIVAVGFAPEELILDDRAIQQLRTVSEE